MSVGDGGGPETPLSAEYRRLMRWYPRQWRLANEDAMLGALLDQADGQGRQKPTAAERSALARSGLAQRFGVSRRSPSRVTLLLGGSAIALSTVIPLLARIVFVFPLSNGTEWLYFSWRPLAAPLSAGALVVGFIILALGVRREPGIAGASIIGKVALVVFALAFLAQAAIGSLPMFTLGTSETVVTLTSVAMWSAGLLELAALIVASIVVLRAGMILGVARWGLIGLAIATAAMFALLPFSNPVIGMISFWSYPAVLIVQLIVGVIYILSGRAALLTDRLPVDANRA